LNLRKVTGEDNFHIYPKERSNRNLNI